MTGPGSSGAAGAAGAGTTCSGGVQRTIIVDCGYPYSSSNALTSVTFNESDVLRAIEPSGSASAGVVRLFYNDEHALTLGVRSVVVKTASGSTTTDYAVSRASRRPRERDQPPDRLDHAGGSAERARSVATADVAVALHHGCLGRSDESHR